MELLFNCPHCGNSFTSSAWMLEDYEGVVVDDDGNRRLGGQVRVICPTCGQCCDFRPDELACPFTGLKHDEA